MMTAAAPTGPPVSRAISSIRSRMRSGAHVLDACARTQGRAATIQTRATPRRITSRRKSLKSEKGRMVNPLLEKVAASPLVLFAPDAEEDYDGDDADEQKHAHHE